MAVVLETGEIMPPKTPCATIEQNTGKIPNHLDYNRRLKMMALKIFYPYQMDTDREINAIKKLIPSASGERLMQLTQRLSFSLKKKQDEQQSKQNACQEEDTIEPEVQPPSLTIKENAKAVKIIEINSKDLSDIYITSDRVKDFMKKCIDYVMNNFTKDEQVLKLIKMKCYVQLKVYFEYYHDKPYEPSFKTLKRSFYVDKLIQRSNLVQSVDELKSVIENNLRIFYI
jgi:hypothetical protein